MHRIGFAILLALGALCTRRESAAAAPSRNARLDRARTDRGTRPENARPPYTGPVGRQGPKRASLVSIVTLYLKSRFAGLRLSSGGMREASMFGRERSKGQAAIGIALFALASGCASSSIKSDERRVRELLRAPSAPEHSASFARVAERDVEAGQDAEAKKLLREPLDADRAARIALLQNRELRAALRDMGVTRGQVLQAGLLPNPEVGVELVPGHEAGSRPEIELHVEWDVMSAILAPLHESAAAPLIDAVRYEAASAVVALGFEAREAFYALQAAEERAAIALQMQQALAASLEATRAMHTAGNLPELALAQEELANGRALVVLDEVRLGVELERERFLSLLGVEREPNDPPLTLASTLSTVPEAHDVDAELAEHALQASFELQAIRHRLEALERQAGMARTAGWLPDLEVGVIALREPEDDHFRVGGSLRVGVPLFNRDQGTASALEAERDALLERYYQAIAEVRAGARIALAKVRSAHARALRYQTTIVPAQQRLAEQSLLHYNAMQIGVLDLLRALRDRLEVQMAYAETQREYWSELAALRALRAGQRVRGESGHSPTTRSAPIMPSPGRAGGH
jgi:outer membrane protein TolC